MNQRVDRQAGTAQGLVLSVASTMSVMGAVVMAPLLPSLHAHFAATPGVDFLVPMALTVPSLCVALLAPIIGVAADRIGRRRAYLIALLFYVLCGTAPLYLNTLPQILVSRVGVGIAEAIIMVCSTTLLGDYFTGSERVKWLSAQSAIASVSGVVFIMLGGVLGRDNWRIPFAMYALSVVLFAATLLWTWEPAPRERDAPQTQRFPWGSLLSIGVLTVIGSLLFYLIPVQMGAVLAGHGVTSPASIGALISIASIAIPVGAVLFRLMALRMRLDAIVCLPFLLMGVGLIALGRTGGPTMDVVAASVHQLGGGFVLPVLLTMALQRLPFELRGRGTGIWMCGFFLGQFISAPVAIGAMKAAGGVGISLGWLGGVSLAVCVMLVVAAIPRARREGWGVVPNTTPGQ
ncbi:major facilitator transporter [Caballeronia glebae]|uniref:Major facilitator transporter n=1 Tax=Caballeronia glebae TaxID=1777143 RepID=A0A158A3M7_9BURK|nr:MFS transporter [Caballeronia glebae]SAK52345.1 major facilitator transporter [Caballeronia glebae]